MVPPFLARHPGRPAWNFGDLFLYLVSQAPSVGGLLGIRHDRPQPFSSAFSWGFTRRGFTRNQIRQALSSARDGGQKHWTVSTYFIDILINRSCQPNVHTKKRVRAGLRASEGSFLPHHG